jgi:hypothetical protein
MNARLANGANGRAASGRFAPGNPGGPGNPHGARTARLRAELLKTVTPADVKRVVKTLVALATQGDVQAAALLLGYACGKPAQAEPPEPVQVEPQVEPPARLIVSGTVKIEEFLREMHACGQLMPLLEPPAVINADAEIKKNIGDNGTVN